MISGRVRIGRIMSPGRGQGKTKGGRVNSREGRVRRNDAGKHAPRVDGHSSEEPRVRRHTWSSQGDQAGCSVVAQTKGDHGKRPRSDSRGAPRKSGERPPRRLR